MAILKVARMGHPVLRQNADSVTKEQIASPEFQQFCDDLLQTMHEYDGAGLAAPQVHTPLRVVVLTLEDEPEFFVNPEIEVLTEEVQLEWEGCLSVPGLRGLVQRPNHIRIRALDRDGTPKAYELQGFPAVVVQHECDHLDGILYVDRVIPESLAFIEEFRRYGPLFDFEGEEDREEDEQPELDEVN